MLISLCKRLNYPNGWYRERSDDCRIGFEAAEAEKVSASYCLYRADGSLVAENLKTCEVYANGWYLLGKSDGVNVLYCADGQPVYIGVTEVKFYPAGLFWVAQGQDKFALHLANGQLVMDNLEQVYVFKNGYSVCRKCGEHSCRFLAPDGIETVEHYGQYFTVSKDETRVSLYKSWDDDPCEGEREFWDICSPEGRLMSIDEAKEYF